MRLRRIGTTSTNWAGMKRRSLRVQSTRTRGGRIRSRLLIGTGAVLVLATAAWQLNATLWMNHSKHVGSSLISKERRIQRQAVVAKGVCHPATQSNSVAGLLEIPSISLVAPVEQGTTDPVLNVAVGHDAHSVWPGTNGTAVFNAHDVSYFLNIDRLKTGDQVIYETACTEYEFEVQSHAVVTAGAPVYNTPDPSVTLVTCWPTNALWFTPNRYLVTAIEVAKRPLSSPTASTVASPNDSPPAVNAPPALVSQGLGLTTNYIPMGSMTLAGSPSNTFVQSPAPLNMEASALEAFIGGIKSLGQHQIPWWNGLAPGVTPVQPLIGATVSSYEHELDVTVNAAGDTPTSVEFHTTAVVTGGAAPGTYNFAVDFAVALGKMTIKSWQLVPA